MNGEHRLLYWTLNTVDLDGTVFREEAAVGGERGGAEAALEGCARDAVLEVAGAREWRECARFAHAQLVAAYLCSGIGIIYL